jgi:hypothetical protein
MLVEVEILRTRTVTIDESAVVEIDVPDSVPEEDQEDWILEQISEGHLTVADSEFEVSDETEDSEYQEINKV